MKQVSTRVVLAVVVSGVLLGLAAPASALLRTLRESEFEQDAEHWFGQSGDTFYHRPFKSEDPSSQGAPRSRNGHVASIGSLADSGFHAPGSFVGSGDWTAAYRGQLSYYHRSEVGNPIVPRITIFTLRGRLEYEGRQVPSREWTRVQVPLHERKWTFKAFEEPSGREPTRNEFLCALAEVRSLDIVERDDDVPTETEWFLDQVTLDAPSAAGQAAADRRIRFSPRRLDFKQVAACDIKSEVVVVKNPLPRAIRLKFVERAAPQNGFAWGLSGDDADFCGVIAPHDKLAVVAFFAPPTAGKYQDAIPFEFERNPFKTPPENFTVSYSLEGEGIAGAVGSGALVETSLETRTLPPGNGAPAAPAVTFSTVLQAGVTYKLVATGTVTSTFQRFGSRYDAVYCYEELLDGVPDPNATQCTRASPQARLRQITITLGGVETSFEALDDPPGGPVTFPPYDDLNHRYEVTFTAQATGNLIARGNPTISPEPASGSYTLEIRQVGGGGGPTCPTT